MKHLLLSAVLILSGCTDPIDPPVTVSRGSGIEAVSSVSVVTLDILSGKEAQDLTPGTRVQRTLVTWLKANPDAEILNFNVVGFNGHPMDIVMITKGKLGSN